MEGCATGGTDRLAGSHGSLCDEVYAYDLESLFQSESRLLTLPSTLRESIVCPLFTWDAVKELLPLVESR